MAGSIRIITWNTNGLRQHKSELEIFLEDHKIDVYMSNLLFHERIQLKNPRLQILPHIFPTKPVEEQQLSFVLT